MGSGADAIGVLLGDVWNRSDLEAPDRVFASDALISEAWVAATADEMVASLAAEA